MRARPITQFGLCEAFLLLGRFAPGTAHSIPVLIIFVAPQPIEMAGDGFRQLLIGPVTKTIGVVVRRPLKVERNRQGWSAEQCRTSERLPPRTVDAARVSRNSCDRRRKKFHSFLLPWSTQMSSAKAL